MTWYLTLIKDELFKIKWKVEQNVCERCGHSQISVHPDCERYECANCGYMMQSIPCKRDYDEGSY